MSVIQRIRDKGAWIIFSIIALALIAFILQDGLGRRGSLFSNTTTVGKINGEAIEKVSFEQKLELYGKQRPREELIGQLWNQEVSSIILKQEYNKLGLVCLHKELEDNLFGENSPLKREFTDPKTGIFNVAQAKQAFAQLKKSKNAEQLSQIYQAYIDPAIQQSLQGKYQSLIQNALYVPKWMIQKQQADNNAIASVSYVYVPYSSVVDSTIKISDEDVLSYARKHKKEFEKEEESKDISYVSFDVVPSIADSLKTKNDLEVLKHDFVAATDMKNYFAKVSSEMSFYDSYISKSEIKQPVKDSLFKLAVGATYGPYVDGNNFVIAKMVGIKQWPDSAKVRHILVSTHQQDPQTGSLSRIKEDTTARKRMDTVEMLLAKGASFDSICAKFSDDGNKDKGGVYDYFTTSKMVPTFNDFSFDKPVGFKGVIQTDYGYHYVEVLGHKGAEPAYKIAYLSKPILTSSETINTISTAAAQLAATSKDKKQLEENAIKMGKTAAVAGDIKENDAMISGIGSSRQSVRWIYDHKVGDITDPPLDLNNKFVVALVTADNKKGLPSVQTLRPLVEFSVRNEKKGKQIIESKFKGNSLDSYAASAGASVQKADSLTFNNPFVPGVGNEIKFIGAAFNNEIKGKVTEPIAGASGVFALSVLNIGAKPNLSNDVEGIKQNILQSQRMAAYRGMESLKKAASIQDFRSKFY